MTMSDKEVEAGLSLLHMMQPAAATAEKEAAVKQESHEGVHASLLRAVASQADLLTLACVATPPSSESESADSWQSRGLLKRNTQLTTLSRELSLDQLRAHFNKPIVEVAKEFGICTTFLKKICRRCGIKRWPHRQIRSLSRTIQMLRQAEGSATTPQERAKFATQIAQLEAKKRAVIQDPDANSKLKRVKKCGAKQRGAGAGSSSKSSSSSGSSAGDVDMEASDEDLDDADALRLLQMVGAQRSATLEIDRPRSDTQVSTRISVDASSLDTPKLGGNGATPSPLMSPLVAAIAKTPTTSVLKAQRVSASMSSDDAESAELASHRMSPSNRKLLFGPTKLCDAETRLRSSSMGSLQDENEQPAPATMLEVSI